MISAIILVGGIGLVAWTIHRLFQVHASDTLAHYSVYNDMLAMIQKKDERIAAMDADYKAIVESYLRETGKVYVRPAMAAGEKLQPPQPSPFRFHPPPPLVQRPKVGK